jgi:hypothetical protein
VGDAQGPSPLGQACHRHAQLSPLSAHPPGKNSAATVSPLTVQRLHGLPWALFLWSRVLTAKRNSLEPIMHQQEPLL